MLTENQASTDFQETTQPFHNGPLICFDGELVKVCLVNQIELPQLTCQAIFLKRNHRQPFQWVCDLSQSAIIWATDECKEKCTFLGIVMTDSKKQFLKLFKSTYLKQQKVKQNLIAIHFPIPTNKKLSRHICIQLT